MEIFKSGVDLLQLGVTAMGGGARMWIGILLVCFLLPAVLTWCLASWCFS